MDILNPAEPDAHAVKAAVDALGRSFEEFKAAQAEQTVASHKDVLLEHKIDRLNLEMSQLQSKLDRMHLAAQRPALARSEFADPDRQEFKTAFYDGFVRKGNDSALLKLEAKDMNIGTPGDGGYAVPDELDQKVETLLRNISPMRQLATVVRIGSANYRKLVSTTGFGSGWVGEDAARTETTTTTFAEVVPPLGEIYANPAATQSMLDDAFFDVEHWLSQEIATEFSIQEGTAFITGNGTNKPKGITSYSTATTADGSRAFGTLQHIITGVNGAFPSTDPADKLIDLVHSLKPVYRQGAVFLMNTTVLAQIRKFKDAEDNYLWRPGLAEGAPATLLGYPVYEVEDIPTLATGSLSVAFGNFAHGYTITDRGNIRILRDPYSNKPFVHFYTTKRVGGGVVNSDCIKFLKFTA